MPLTRLYNRYLGWHASAIERVAVGTAIGAVLALALLPFAPWWLAVVAGWDLATVLVLGTVWLVAVRSDSDEFRELATRDDPTRPLTTLLLVSASTASLVGVGFALGLAGRQTGSGRVALIGFAVATVVLSWTVVNTVYMLRYAHLHFSSPARGVEFLSAESSPPTYADFAYLAFTIGMTYQVSDTALRSGRMRRAVLTHSFLSYLFGVVIVAGTINLISGLLG